MLVHHSNLTVLLASLCVVASLAGADEPPANANDAAAARGAVMKTFHVTPQGADSGPGTQHEPFATIVRARDAIRQYVPSEIGLVDVQANFLLNWKDPVRRSHGITAVHNEQLKSPAHVVCRAAKRIRFERCTFTRLGGAGIDVEFGSQGNVISRCHFHDNRGISAGSTWTREAASSKSPATRCTTSTRR